MVNHSMEIRVEQLLEYHVFDVFSGGNFYMHVMLRCGHYCQSRLLNEQTCSDGACRPS